MTMIIIIITRMTIIIIIIRMTIITAKVLNYHHRLSDTHEMPDWVSSIFLQWLPWLLRYYTKKCNKSINVTKFKSNKQTNKQM